MELFLVKITLARTSGDADSRKKQQLNLVFPDDARRKAAPLHACKGCLATRQQRRRPAPPRRALRCACAAWSSSAARRAPSRRASTSSTAARWTPPRGSSLSAPPGSRPPHPSPSSWCTARDPSATRRCEARLNTNSSESGRAFYMATLDVLSTTECNSMCLACRHRRRQRRRRDMVVRAQEASPQPRGQSARRTPTSRRSHGPGRRGQASARTPRQSLRACPLPVQGEASHNPPPGRGALAAPGACLRVWGASCSAMTSKEASRPRAKAIGPGGTP